VRELTFDGERTVRLVLDQRDGQEAHLSVCIPDNYPKEELVIFSLGDSLSCSSDVMRVEPCHLQHLLASLVDNYSNSETEMERMVEEKGDEVYGEEEEDEDYYCSGDEEYYNDSGEEYEYEDEYQSLDMRFEEDEEFQEKYRYNLRGSVDQEWQPTKRALEMDIKALRLRYPELDFGFHMDPFSGTFTIRILISTSWITKQKALCWGIDNSKPLMVELQTSLMYINNQEMPPKVLSVLQVGEKVELDVENIEDTFSTSASWYLKDRLSNALRKFWVKYYRKDQNPVPIPADYANQDDSSCPFLYHYNFSSKSTFPNLKKINTPSPEALGLSPYVPSFLIYLATQAVGGDKDKTRALFSDPAEVEKLIKESGYHGTRTNWKKIKNRSQYDQFFQQGKNFLFCVIEYIKARICAYNYGCTICDATLSISGAKPVVCSSSLCQHSLMSYGIGFDLCGLIQNNPLLLDLLITITSAAAINPRGGGVDVFEPYPQILDEDHNLAFYFINDNTKDLNKLAEVINKIPPLKKLKKYTEEIQLKRKLDSIDPLCYPVMLWIYHSLSSHISVIPKDQQMVEMATPHQFVLLSDSPRKEKAFQKKRNRKGSFYAFHGSSIGNWHSIFRGGLRNYSNTSKMSCGAAYGAGIYMAKHASTSNGYMHQGGVWKNTTLCNGTAGCMALCEVIDRRSMLGRIHLAPIRTTGGIYVLRDESLVVTRYFFVYPGSSPSSADADTLNLPENLYNDKKKGK